MKRNCNIAVDRHYVMLTSPALCKHSIILNIRGPTARLKESVL